MREMCRKFLQCGNDLRKHVSCHLKPFPCSSCDKGFYKAKTLQKHQLSHQLREAQENDPDKLLRCNQCDRKFRLLRQLRVHQASHRHEKTPLKCNTCDRTFTTSSALQERPFKCSECDKAFKCRMGLLQHRLLHTGVKPHRCEQCGKEFRTPQNYHRHLLVHTGEKPYQCYSMHRCEVSDIQLKQSKHVPF
uniref:Zinc finger protein 708-like n=1 Tax=Seriola dumerili TaxID=41447 RepID=A0A3B4TKV1_SERDU